MRREEKLRRVILFISLYYLFRVKMEIKYNITIFVYFRYRILVFNSIGLLSGF